MLPALLLHGFGSDRLSWSLTEGSLTEGSLTEGSLTEGANGTTRQLFIPDLPGHGEAAPLTGVVTLAALSEAVWASVNAPRVHVIGHSLGGAIALDLARTFPERVASLTLIAPAGVGDGIDRTFLEQFPTLDNASDTEALLHRLVVRPRLISRPLVARVLAHLNKPGIRPALTAIAAMVAQLPALSLPSLPTRVIWGMDDRLNPCPSDGMIERIANVGHLPHMESPGPVNRLIADHVRENDRCI